MGSDQQGTGPPRAVTRELWILLGVSWGCRPQKLPSGSTPCLVETQPLKGTETHRGGLWEGTLYTQPDTNTPWQEAQPASGTQLRPAGVSVGLEVDED